MGRTPVVAVLGVVLACAACALPRTASPAPPSAAAVPLSAPSSAAVGSSGKLSPRATAPSASPGAGCAGSDGGRCDQRRRFDAVAGYVAPRLGAHGYLGVVFTDRTTGRTWRYGATGHPGWTASTIKLAIATDLLERSRAGTITLGPADRHDLATMLNFSDEAASDRLWKRFGGQPMLDRFVARYGMRGLHFVPGFTAGPYWGFVKCTTDDLAALMGYVLDRTDPADRDYLVAALRGVAPNQRWGVWAAGPDQRPGNKDGWSDEQDAYGRHWVTSTVGFAGSGERYLVAVTYQLDPAGTLADGVHTVSDVVALLFGRPVPAPVTMPLPDG